MSSHRYWRVQRLITPLQSDLVLSEIQLCNGATRADGGAVLTASAAPVSGSLASLSDGATTAVARFLAGVVFHWDLGAAAEVNNLCLGAGDSPLTFPLAARLEFSDDDATWSVEARFDRISYPGVRTLTDNVDAGNWDPARAFLTNAAGTTSSVSFNTARDLATMIVGSYPPKVVSSLQLASPKRQVEFVWKTNSLTGAYAYVGFGDEAERQIYGRVGSTNTGYGYSNDGSKNRANGASGYGATYAINDVIGAVADASAGTVEFYKNGVSQGVAFSGLDLSSGISPMVSLGTTGPYYVQIKTKGFDYPVAGAADWNSLGLRIRQEALSYSVDVSGGAKRNSSYQSANYSGRVRDVVIIDKGPYGQDVGIGHIRSTVKKKADPVNLPLRRRVRLYSEVDGRLLREVWSDAVTGNYAFEKIDASGIYTVISYDYQHNYRAAIADNLRASVE